MHFEKSLRKLRAKVNNFSAGKMRAGVRDCVWEAVRSYLRDSCWGEHLEYLTSPTCNVMFSSKNVRPPMRQHTKRNVKQARLYKLKGKKSYPDLSFLCFHSYFYFYFLLNIEPFPVYDTEYVKECKTVYDTVNEQVR